MRLGICVALENLRDAAAAGFDFGESTVSTLRPDQDEAAFASVRDQFYAKSIRIEALNCFIPGRLRVTGPAVDLPALRRYVEIVMRRAAEVGVAIIVFGSGGARVLPEGFPVKRGWEQLAAAARLTAEIAGNYGIKIAMEPLFKRGCNFFNRVDQGAALVDRVNHPNLKLLADLFHVTTEQEPFENIAAAGKRLAHVHLGTPSIPETAKGREFDFDGFFRALARAGYDGRLSVEDNPGLLAGKKPPLVAVFRAIREFLASRLAGI